MTTRPDAAALRDARLGRARAALSSVQRTVGTSRESWEAPTLPLSSALGTLLPQGLKRGQVVSVTGSTSLMLALAAQASHEGSWTAIIGMPHVGVVAASRRGIELARLALIPHPGTQAATVAGTCVDGLDVVLLGAGVALAEADRRRLSTRARERGSVMVVAGPWTGAHTTLAVEGSQWRGLGAGDGRLRERRVTVAVGGRSQGVARRVELVLDADAGARWVRPGVRALVDSPVDGTIDEAGS